MLNFNISLILNHEVSGDTQISELASPTVHRFNEDRESFDAMMHASHRLFVLCEYISQRQFMTPATAQNPIKQLMMSSFADHSQESICPETP